MFSLVRSVSWVRRWTSASLNDCELTNSRDPLCFKWLRFPVAATLTHHLITAARRVHSHFGSGELAH